MDKTSPIQKEIEERFQENYQLRRMQVEIDVTAEGNVTLAGVAPGNWNRKLAEDVIAAVDGVKSIQNNLVVIPPAPRLKASRIRS